MAFYEVLEKRRSIRAYRPDPVPEEMLERIARAVQLAPTACNIQPFRFLWVESETAKQAVYDCYKAEWLRNAPLIAVALGNREQAWKRLDGASAHTLDVAIAFEHLVLAAAAEGLGTCWICAFDQQRLHRNLELGPEWEAVAFTPLGFPAESPEPRSRKPLDTLFQRL